MKKLIKLDGKNSAALINKAMQRVNRRKFENKKTLSLAQETLK